MELDDTYFDGALFAEPIEPPTTGDRSSRVGGRMTARTSDGFALVEPRRSLFTAADDRGAFDHYITA
ncbi:hypothetical protein [Caballeronia sp. HLA56]